jgi:hypothetical protein
MKKDNKPYDSAFKDLADQDPEGLLLLLGALPLGAKVKALPREVTTPALLPDQPYEVISETEHSSRTSKRKLATNRSCPNGL